MMPVFFRPLLRDSAKLNARTVRHSRRAVKDYACPFVSFRQACMERRGGPVSVTEFIGMQARSSDGWTEAASGGCGVVASR